MKMEGNKRRKRRKEAEEVDEDTDNMRIWRINDSEYKFFFLFTIYYTKSAINVYAQ
jgi:hypothetical protein